MKQTMSDEWLIENGIEPADVTDNLRSLLSLCDDPKYADMLRVLIIMEEEWTHKN